MPTSKTLGDRRRQTGPALAGALCLAAMAWTASAQSPGVAENSVSYICLSNSCSAPARVADARAIAPASASRAAAGAAGDPAARTGVATTGAGEAAANNYMNWNGSAEDLLNAWSGSDKPQLARMVEPMVPGSARFLPSDDGAQVITYDLAAGGTKTITRGGSSNPPGYTQVRTTRPGPPR